MCCSPLGVAQHTTLGPKRLTHIIAVRAASLCSSPLSATARGVFVRGSIRRCLARALSTSATIGAETPSQLLLFLLAANLGGTSRGLIGLLCFLVGLLAMNTLMTASASGIFASSVARPQLQTAVSSLTAVYSFAVGTIFLFGLSDKLPALVR